MCLGPCFWYRFCPNHPDKNRGNHHTIVMYDLSITISRSARFPRRSRNFMILKFGNNSGKIIMYDVFYSTKNNLVSANHRRVGREFSGFLRNIFTNHNTYIRHFSLRVRLEYFFWKIMLIFSRNILLIPFHAITRWPWLQNEGMSFKNGNNIRLMVLKGLLVIGNFRPNFRSVPIFGPNIANIWPRI